MHLFTSAVISGTLLLIAMPGNGSFWYLSFIALVPLMWFSLFARPAKAFYAGLMTGMILATGTLYWIPSTLVNYGSAPWPLGCAALIFLALYMALYCGLFAASIGAGCHLFPGSLFFLPLTAPLIWASLEFARGHLFTGFPWMDLGYALSFQTIPIQVADIFGHLGVSFFIVQVNSLLVLGWYLIHKRPDRVHLLPFTAALVCIIFVISYGATRGDSIEQEIKKAPTISLATLQGNIDQSVKWSAAMEQKTLGIYGSLMENVQKKHTPDLMILPETALPFYTHSPAFLDFLGARPNPSPWILTGIPRFAPSSTQDKNFTLFNSAVLINPVGATTGWYAKNHLVPFGEYVPLASILPIPRPLVESAGSYSPGTPEPPLSCLGAKIGVLICFESIFPKLAAEHTRRGATLLVNITNDGWYDTTNVPYQTLAMTVVRAVETRRSIARSANTGISAFITPSGIVRSQTPLKQKSFVAGTLPLLTTTTFFTRWRPFWAVLFSIGFCTAVGITIYVIVNDKQEKQI